METKAPAPTLSFSDEETCDTESVSTRGSSDDDDSSCRETTPGNNNSDSCFEQRFSWRCCGYCGLIFMAFLLWLGAAFYTVFFVVWPPTPIAECGDCHCSVAEGSQCPSWLPQTDYSDDIIETLASQVPINPFTLSCNPYTDEDCETNPPQEMTELGETAVCALHYEDDPVPAATAAGTDNNNGMGARYRMQSYASRPEAEAAGAVVTHAGACGVCSTTQDLAAYLRSSDLTTSGRRCSMQGLLSFDLGVDCYQQLGFTETCAEMWIYNGYNTRDNCMLTCIAHTFSDNNGPAPQCALNSCLQCDEDHSGPFFKKFAARTRRRSGLLSAIVRPCDALHQITHVAFPDR